MAARPLSPHDAPVTPVMLTPLAPSASASVAIAPGLFSKSTRNAFTALPPRYSLPVRDSVVLPLEGGSGDHPFYPRGPTGSTSKGTRSGPGGAGRHRNRPDRGKTEARNLIDSPLSSHVVLTRRFRTS